MKHEDLADKVTPLLESGRAEDLERAKEIVEKSAEEGDPDAIYTLAKWYRVGFANYPKNRRRDLELTNAAAAQLVPDAIYDLGAYALKAKDRQARRRAFSFFVVAAIMGDISAMRAVVQALDFGVGATRNKSAADMLDKYIKQELTPYREQKGLPLE